MSPSIFLSSFLSQSRKKSHDVMAFILEVMASVLGILVEGVSKLNASELKVKDVVVFLDHGGHHDTRAKGKPEA